MAKAVNPFFFKNTDKNSSSDKADLPKPQITDKNDDVKFAPVTPITINPQLTEMIKESARYFAVTDNPQVSRELIDICNRGMRNRFSVAVVGEFSRGKSTFINNFLQKKILPVGDLPTTAMLTRIRYSRSEKLIHFDRNNQKMAELDICDSAWNGLTAENFSSDDPVGTVFAGVNDLWLGKNNVELIDTPGAGDLEEKRARVIGDALVGCDGAIITVSATSPLSKSEKMFIEQRLISRKVPFIMLIITKMDLVPEDERDRVIEYIISKLKGWDMNIPVYIPIKVDTPSNKFADIMGTDKIKAQIQEWINYPDRVTYTEEWIKAQVLAVLDRELTVLDEQKELMSANETKRTQLIEEKKQKLVKAEIAWEDLRLNMLKKGNDCFAKFADRVAEYTVTITERLQYEASHSSSPEKWWKEDYQYRLRTELSNMAVGVDNTVSRIIAEDTRWFNQMLEHNFKTNVMCQREVISDKDVYKSAATTKDINLKDLSKPRTAVRIGVAATTITSYLIFGGMGCLPIVANIGLNTGATLVSENIFKNKIEQQRVQIKQTIASEVPRIIADATAESESRLKAVYNDIIKAAEEKEKSWTQAQLNAIERSIKPVDENRKSDLLKQIASLEECIAKFEEN